MAAPVPELLMVGMSAKTYRIGNLIRKVCNVRIGEEYATEQNRKACEIEADVYTILDKNPFIADCLLIGPKKEFIKIEYYPNGTLKDHIKNNAGHVTKADLLNWAIQMIKGVAYIHSKGIRHSDLRLDQWLLDGEYNARLSDFNASGFDEQRHLGLEGRAAIGLEKSSHFLPRDPDEDNTVESDLFALGSCLYELVAGECPYEGEDDLVVMSLYEEGKLVNPENLYLGDIISGCWERRFSSADDILISLRKEVSHHQNEKAVGQGLD